MNKVFKILATTLVTTSLFAQSPEKVSYQAVVRDAGNNLIVNQKIGIQINILQGSASGTAVYTEIHTPTSNANGLVALEIGAGTTSDDFSSIDWSGGPYFIETEIDPTGGTNYTITSTNQLLSVPYALHAKSAQMLTGGIIETDPIYSASEAVNITATDIAKLGNLSGINTGDQDPSGLASQDALEDTALAIRNAIPDVSGFISSETDPLYSASEAANITATDITHLDNLSGINTGDQDLSGLATKAYVDALLEELFEEGALRVRDIDGNYYNTILLGNQLWMIENLKTTRYNDGTVIPEVTGSTDWSNLTTGGYCWYNNNETVYKNTYGALYNWYTVNTDKLCPVSWHVPSNDEWTELIDYLDGSTIAGGKLKETGTSHWISPNTGATNESGFTALPGGHRNSDGIFENIGYFGNLWSSTTSSPDNAYHIWLENTSASSYIETPGFKWGLNIRCVKD